MRYRRSYESEVLFAYKTVGCGRRPSDYGVETYTLSPRGIVNGSILSEIDRAYFSWNRLEHTLRGRWSESWLRRHESVW